MLCLELIDVLSVTGFATDMGEQAVSALEIPKLSVRERRRDLDIGH